MGLLGMGGAGMGFNCVGRLREFLVSNDDNGAVTVKVVSHPTCLIFGLDIYQKAFMNGDYYGESKILGNYTLQRQTPSSDIVFDVLPLPGGAPWRDYPGPFAISVTRSLRVAWDGDADTERYIVKHSTEVTHADERTSAIIAANTEIAWTNDSDSLAEIEVTGVDGNLGPEGNYTIIVNNFVTLSVSITDNVTSEVMDTVTWEGNPISFGRGLSLKLITPWLDLVTTFTVITGPKREYILKTPKDNNHWFKIVAKREEDHTIAESAWVNYSITNPPSPVSDIGVTFVSSTSVTIGFTMPSDSDIYGYYIFMSDLSRGTNLIPEYHPRAAGSAIPNQSLNVLISDLTAGKYYFYVRSLDSTGMDDETTNVQSFVLTATNVAFGEVTAPFSVEAEATDLGEVTLTATTDKKEDQLNIYSDGGTGTIDWVTPYDTVASTLRVDTIGVEYGTYTVVMTGIAAGEYLFGVRCSLTGTDDGNEDVYDDVTVFDAALDAPSNVTVSEIIDG